MIKKTLQRSEDCFVQFTDDEMAELGIELGDKFSCKIQDDGSLKLEKYAELEIDLADYSREVLELLIELSLENDCTVSEAFEMILREYIDDVDDEQT